MNNPLHELILTALQDKADELRPPTDGPDPAVIFADFIGQQLGHTSGPTSDTPEPQADSAVDHSQGVGGARHPGDSVAYNLNPADQFQHFLFSNLNP